eukprot:6925700-Pyramimonas_sp.AAC.1
MRATRTWIRGGVRLFRSGALAPRDPGIAGGDPALPSTAWREGDWATSNGHGKGRGGRGG